MLPPQFRQQVNDVRVTLDGRERRLFDLLCVAGHLGRSLPMPSATADQRGRKGSAPQADACRRTNAKWHRTRVGGDECSRRALSNSQAPPAPGKDDYRLLRVLLGNASIALAPDCHVPTDPILLVAWKTIVALFARLYRSAIRPLGGRMLAVDRRLMKAVGKALGLAVEPGYEARYNFYARQGDYFWPHPDDPEYAVNVLVCLDHKRPATGTGSAPLAYRPDGSVERCELTPGNAIAFEARGLVHAREPMRRGERMTMPSINVNAI